VAVGGGHLLLVRIQQRYSMTSWDAMRASENAVVVPLTSVRPASCCGAFVPRDVDRVLGADAPCKHVGEEEGCIACLSTKAKSEGWEVFRTWEKLWVGATTHPGSRTARTRTRSPSASQRRGP
jgi:hypothetical protein